MAAVAGKPLAESRNLALHLSIAPGGISKGQCRLLRFWQRHSYFLFEMRLKDGSTLHSMLSRRQREQASAGV